MPDRQARIAVFGSSPISVPVFEAIAAQHRVVVAVISDVPHIRHGKPVLNSVAQWAISRSISLLNGATLPANELVSRLQCEKIDILFLLSYGHILPAAVLESPLLAAINLHPSNLPWYRGAAPIERQIMDGCVTSAVSIIRMSPLLDRGDILGQRSFDIAPDDYRPDVEASIVRAGVPLALEVIDRLLSATVCCTPQLGHGSYARKVTSEEELIDWSLPVARIFNLIRALAPEPGASTYHGNDRIKILRATPLPMGSAVPSLESNIPGFLRMFDRNRAAVRCGDSWLELLRVQFPGKRPLSVPELINGRWLCPGTCLSNSATS